MPSGIAVVVDWSGGPGAAPAVARLLAAMPHRAVDGTLVAEAGPAALGCARHATTHHGAGLWTDPGGLVVAGSIRLDDRAGLAAALGIHDVPLPDEALVAAAYRRWGAGAAARLAGDFAVALWDPARRELWAARDPVGARPLHHAVTASGLALCSEVAPLAALARGGLDDVGLLEFLLGRFRAGAATCFEAVRRLPPGHWLRARPGRLEVERYFWPPAPAAPAPAAERDDQLRAHLRAAVAARLDATSPIVIRLSGGLDSSTVACVAGELRGGGGGGSPGPAVFCASAVFPGLSCDESTYLDALARRLTLPMERYDGSAPDEEADGAGDPGHPWRTVAPAIARGWRQAAQRAGARVALGGFGGDELFLERGALRDLAAHGRLAALLRESGHLAPGVTASRLAWLRDAAAAALPPRVRHPLGALRRAAAPPPLPAWLGPRARRVFGPPADEPELAAAVAAASHATRCTWESLTWAPMSWNLELEELAAARAGIELRHPLLDGALVRFVLSLPWTDRLPSLGAKTLLRRAAAPLLPAAIATRRAPTTFEAVYRLHVQRRRETLRNVLFAGEWRAAPWVDRRAAQALLDRVLSDDGAAWSQARTVWDIASLELWLRMR